MLLPILVSNLLLSLITNTVFAIDCNLNIDNFLPDIKIPDINLKVNEQSYLCIDETLIKDEEMLKSFNDLKNKGFFTRDSCLIKREYDFETQLSISDLIFKATKTTLNVYAFNTSDLKKENKLYLSKAEQLFAEDKTVLVVSNSSDQIFLNKSFINSEIFKKDQSLTSKDNLQIASATISSSLVGIIIERNASAFKNTDGSLQKDKAMHANAGALINIGGVAGAYLIIETAGFGDDWGLTRNQKKWTILLAGTILGMIVGYGKERLYDYNHQDKHTYDTRLKGDMGATWLGGGILNPVMGGISFEF